LAEVERRSLDGACGTRRSDKYGGVLVDRILCVIVANLYLSAISLGANEALEGGLWTMR